MVGKSRRRPERSRNRKLAEKKRQETAKEDNVTVYK